MGNEQGQLQPPQQRGPDQPAGAGVQGGQPNHALQVGQPVGLQQFQVFRRPPRRNGGHHRVRYTAQQKENAIRLLNLGLSYRQVARMTSPHCSSGTPHRWRREATRREEQRRRMEELRRRRRW